MNSSIYRNRNYTYFRHWLQHSRISVLTVKSPFIFPNSRELSARDRNAHVYTLARTLHLHSLVFVDSHAQSNFASSKTTFTSSHVSFTMVCMLVPYFQIECFNINALAVISQHIGADNSKSSIFTSIQLIYDDPFSSAYT